MGQIDRKKELLAHIQSTIKNHKDDIKNEILRHVLESDLRTQAEITRLSELVKNYGKELSSLRYQLEQTDNKENNI